MFDKKQFCIHRFRWGHDPRFGRGFGRGFGGFGPGGFAARFERGDLKFVILDLLKEQPRHGYDVIQELEKRYHGFYSPSPGSVYPILQLLEDQDFVTNSQQGGKKVYTITDAGRTFLTEHAEDVKQMHDRMHDSWEGMHNPEIRNLMHEVKEVAHIVIKHAAQGVFSNPEKIEQMQKAIAHFKNEIEAIFTEKTVKTTVET